MQQVENLNIETDPEKVRDFETLVKEKQDMVYNVVLSIVQHKEDAEDVTQEVFVKIYNRLSQFRQESNINTWIYRIAVNASIDHVKKMKRRKSGGFLSFFLGNGIEDEPAHFDHPGVHMDNKENAAVLFNAINALPEKQKIAFTLHKVENLKARDVAEIMEMNPGAVESLLSRAVVNLRKKLKNHYEQS